jgi:hypothetical protein
MAGQNYTWQVSSPNIGTGVGVISSAYNVNNKSPFTTITQSNPRGYVDVFPNSTSTDFNIKNLQYAIQNDGKITYRVQDGTQNPRQFNSLQELADGRGGWSGSTTQLVQIQMNGILTSSASSNNITPTSTGGSTSPITTLGTPTTLTNEQLGITQSDFLSDLGEIRYPTDIGNNGQDYIKFDLIEYGTREFGTGAGALTQPLGPRNLKNSVGATVILPIQPSINDQNGVNWGEEQMNAFQLLTAAAARNPQGIPDMIGSGVESITSNSAYQELLRKQLAGQAAGINPLARTDGLIVNPNLELLFNGPTLRPFTFVFRLSPRDKGETVNVKKIIRFFKEGSAVKTTNTGLFLKAPNVFDISYNGIGANGLNKIKTCALRNVSVNYTPDGSYMTFRDGTMTSYEINLQFSELEPIYDKDYNDVKGHPIGF